VQPDSRINAAVSAASGKRPKCRSRSISKTRGRSGNTSEAQRIVSGSNELSTSRPRSPFQSSSTALREGTVSGVPLSSICIILPGSSTASAFPSSGTGQQLRSSSKVEDSTASGAPATRSSVSSWTQTTCRSAVRRMSSSMPSESRCMARQNATSVFSGASSDSPRCERKSVISRVLSIDTI